MYAKGEAQEKADLTYEFEQDSIYIENNATFTNSIKITNTGDKEARLTVTADGSKALLSMLKLPPNITVPAKKSLVLYLKYFANRETIYDKIQRFSLSFSSINKDYSIQKSASFYTILKEEGRLILNTGQEEYFMPPQSDELQVFINAINTGLVAKTFRLQLSEIPEGLDFSGDLMTQTVQAGSQHSFVITVKNRRKRVIEDFEVIIRAIGERGDDIGFKKIRIATASSVKRLGSIAPRGNDLLNNMIGLKYSTINNTTSIYQIQGNGDLGLSSSKTLKYQINMDYYQQNAGINLYNTWAEVDGERLNFRLGSIYEMLDYSLNGQGIKLKYKFENNKYLQVFGLENNYMLYTHWGKKIPTEKLIGIEYAWNISDFRKGNVSFIQSHDPYRNLNISQFNIKHAIIEKASVHLDVEGGYSIARKEHADPHKAWALGVNYHQQWAKYQISNSLYYSSPYYTGLRKGLTLLESRVSRMLGTSTSLSARTSIQRVEPKLMESGVLFEESISEIRIYELGLQQAFKWGSFSIRPYWMEQKMKSHFGDLGSKAIRSIIELNLYKGSHRFSTNTDIGFVKSVIHGSKTNFHSIRFNGSYNYRSIGLSGYIQKNPYYLSELYENSTRFDEYIYSLGPNIQFDVFKRQLQIQGSSTYNYYTNTASKNIMLNANARWRLSNGWQLTAEAFVSRLSNIVLQRDYIENTQFRAGIEHHFSSKKSNKGKDLRLLYYEDRNNNDIRDKEENVIPGVIVRIQDQTAVTDEQGTVSFLDMKEGAYDVEVISTKNWGAGRIEKLIVTKNTKKEIGLKKTVALRGKIEVIQNPYEHTAPIIAGIKIEAMDSNGQRYNTLSDNEGYYTFYLPRDTYMISINTEGMPFSIENPTNGVNLNEDREKGYTLNFKYIDQHRRIEIKQF